MTTEHFDGVVSYVMGDDDSELAKVKAERDYALHCLERELAIAQAEQARSAALSAQLAESVDLLDDLLGLVRGSGEGAIAFIQRYRASVGGAKE